MRKLLGTALLFGLACLSGAPAADEKKKPDVYLTPEEAGPDYQVQGEYEGQADGAKWGAQVVALGAGKFDVYFLKGGLPGAGWDRKTRIKCSAATADGKTTLTGKDCTGAIADGKLTAKLGEGKEFTLARVARKSPTLGLKPPQDAVVLFDGTGADAWAGGKIVEKDLLNCGTRTAKSYRPVRFHIEFRTPFQPKARGQGRGNSGVYLGGNEIQVLDSFGLNGEKNECGAFYGSAKPDVNMCLPPLTWQTYDVELKPGEKDALLATVLHNGVKVHENYPLKGLSPGKPFGISLQNHGNPVVYRNIWLVEAPAGKP
jgi:hypothetical protein